jgi:hypothetical protein
MMWPEPETRAVAPDMIAVEISGYLAMERKQLTSATGRSF